MTGTDSARLIRQARDLTHSLATRVPGHPPYPWILDTLDRVERADEAMARFEASRGLGMEVARELESEPGDAGRLADLLFQVRDALRKEAGLPYYA